MIKKSTFSLKNVFVLSSYFSLKCSLLCIFLIISLLKVKGQTTSLKDSLSSIDSNRVSKIYPKRLAVVGGITVFSYSYVYYYMKTQAWWKDTPVPFHFDEGRDKVYARGHDKMGHFLVGGIISDRMGALFEWSGIPKKRAALYGALWSTATQVVVELKDGYAPTYGFSWRDASFGTLGSLYSLSKSHSKFLANTEIKFSYYKRQFGLLIDPVDRKHSAAWHDDYINQTYWFSMNIKNNVPFLKETKFPDWLNLALGASLDQTTDGHGKGNREWYLSLDIDTKRLFKPKKLFWKTVVNSLVYIKIPAPGIQFGRNVPFKAFPLYY